MRGGDYQIATRSTAIYPGQGETDGLVYVTMGLAGEAGEISNKVKKILRDQAGVVNDDNIEDLVQEIGDVMWYAARLADEIGVSLGQIMTQNIEKLRARQQAGTLGGSGDAR